MKYVYIAGPLSSGPAAGVRAALVAATMLLDRGYWPFVPHLSHYWDIVAPQPYEIWMRLDLAWIKRCDWVLRLPGESPGADREVLFACEIGIPVHYGDALSFLIAQGIV